MWCAMAKVEFGVMTMVVPSGRARCGLHADRARRAAAVVHHEVPPAVLRHALRQHACEGVGRPAGRPGHYDVDGTVRQFVLRAGGARAEAERYRAQAECSAGEHVLDLPVVFVC
jgi:hypothetical protein